MLELKVSDAISAVLQQVHDGLADRRPLMADLAQVLASEAERQFGAQEGPLGAWPALTATTIKRRTEAGAWPGQKLQVSGGLAASVQTAFGDDFASIGSNKVYAAMQFFGGTTSPRSMFPNAPIPARPYLPFNPETEQLSAEAEATVLDVLDTYLGRLAA